MSKVQLLRALVEQRMSLAAEEIFGLFERMIAEYEEELCRSKEDNQRNQKQLEAGWNPEVLVHTADFKPPFEQQEWSPGPDQEEPEPDPEPPYVKEELEELWTNQEADIGMVIPTVTVKNDDDEVEEALEPDGVEWAGPQPDVNFLHRLDLNSRTSLFPRSMCRQNLLGSVRASVFSQSENDSCIDTNVSGDDIRPHHCPECPLTFGRRSHLSRHVKIHTGEKPFSCSDCGKGFGRKSALTFHMRVHTGERPFSCSICKKSFKEKGKVNRHMLTHTRERKFECSVCGNTFSQKSNLMTHMTVHSGKKTFSCSVCGKWFSLKGNLQAHMKMHMKLENTAKAHMVEKCPENTHTDLHMCN